jgi:ParB-like chromosome segregation protein Spo0J
MHQLLKRAKELAVTDFARSRPSARTLPTAFTVRKNGKVLEDHPVANLFPLLDKMETEPGELTGSEQFEQLVESMRLHGFDSAQPIWLYEGKILDGRNRYRAAKLASVEPITEVWIPRHGDDPVSFVLRMNLQRRHLKFADRVRLIAGADQLRRQQARERARESGRKGGKSRNVVDIKGHSKDAAPGQHASKHESSQDTAKDVGVSQRTVARYRHMQAKHPEIWRRFQNQEISWKEARRLLDAHDKENRLSEREHENQKTPQQATNYCLLHSDILSAPVRDGSLTAIVTDPFYAKEYLGCYEKLAEFSAKKLRPGGNLVVLTGQASLFEFAKPFLGRPELTYVWTLCWYAPGASTQVFGRKIKSNWKPVLWFVKGKNKNEHINDIVMAAQTKGSDTRFHRYGQDVGAFVDIIKRFTANGDLVCDPFCGGGTTGVACLLTGRKFLGIDNDGQCVLEAEKRLQRI